VARAGFSGPERAISHSVQFADAPDENVVFLEGLRNDIINDDPLNAWLRLPEKTSVPTEVHTAAGGRVADFEEPCIAWRKSTVSNTGNCVEVAVVDGSVLIRDSANPSGAVLTIPPAAWSAFLAHARSKDFDLAEPSQARSCPHRGQPFCWSNQAMSRDPVPWPGCGSRSDRQLQVRPFIMVGSARLR
jgi:hypothetical protein